MRNIIGSITNSNPSLCAGERYYAALFGIHGDLCEETIEVFRASDLMAAKRIAVEIGPAWAEEISVEELQPWEVNQVRMAAAQTKRRLASNK